MMKRRLFEEQGQWECVRRLWFGNVYNSYVIGEYEGKQNPKKEGTGNITITDEGSGSVYGVFPGWMM